MAEEANNAVVKKGDKVSVFYKGTLEDGTIFDSNEGKEPLKFEVGSGQVIKGFDEAVVGMKAGETKSVTLPPEQAYGEPKKELVVKLQKKQFGDQEVKVGMAANSSQGHQGIITDVSGEDVTVDFNFPLSGKTLKFEIKLAGINE